METQINEVEINGVTYVKKGTEQKLASNSDGLPYVIVRAQSAGVFAGYLKKKEDTEVTLVNVRRLWCWYGAASCSQLAIDGVSRPDECKFPAPNTEIIVKNWIEIIPASEKAKKSLEGVKIWKA